MPGFGLSLGFLSRRRRGAAFSPASLPGYLGAWQAESYTAGSPWPAVSGTLTLTADTGTRYPSLVGGAKPYARCDGTDDYLGVVFSSLTNFPELYIGFTSRRWAAPSTGSPRYFEGRGGASSGLVRWVGDSSDGFFRTPLVIASFSGDGHGWAVRELVAAPPTLGGFVAGTSIGSTALASSTLQLNGLGFSAFNFPDANPPDNSGSLPLDIARVVICTTAPTGGNLTAVRAWLAAGIP